jgi:hypothetical protein
MLLLPRLIGEMPVGEDILAGAISTAADSRGGSSVAAMVFMLCDSIIWHFFV